ncbi:hypothetical protein H0A73_17365 [Alcaligenaceae bacterium]|nr:hypothetical protein [Alcaligenaceae bacterium]
MTVQCITCRHFNLRDAGRMAHEGFGNCAHRAAHEFTGARYQRVCGQHEEAPADAVEKRREWLEARQ